MKIRRGDRFKLPDGMIIEYMGYVSAYYNLVVKVIEATPESHWVDGDITLFHKKSVENFDSIAPAETDPLIREAVGEMRNLEFARQLAEAAMVVWPTLEEDNKQAYAAILRDVLPLELKRQIRPGKLCEDCNKEISDIIEDMR